jgi:hypothetical protein
MPNKLKLKYFRPPTKEKDDPVAVTKPKRYKGFQFQKGYMLKEMRELGLL